MIIHRKDPPNPRRGPSCLLVLVALAAAAAGGFMVANAEQVRDTLTPDPTPTPTRSAISYATSADLLVKDGEYGEAIEAYQEAVQMDPDNAAYYLPLIELLLMEGEPAEALTWAERAAELMPEDDRAWTALAAAHLENGFRLAETGQQTEADLDFQRSVNAAETAVQLNANNGEAYAYMAGALAQLGRATFDFTEAQEKAELALALAPDNPLVHQHVGTVLELQGFYDGAIEQYQLALEQNPDLIDLYINIAYLYFFTERRQQAILTMQEAIEKDPESAAAYDGLSYFYFIIGEYARAEENAYEAVQLDPEMTRAHAHLGAAYFKQNNYPLAIEELEIAVEQYGAPTPTNATWFNMLGLAYYFTDASLCSKAEPIFEEVLEISAPGSLGEINANEGLELCRQANLGNTP